MINRKNNMLAISVGIIIVCLLFSWFYRTQTDWVESEPYQKKTSDKAKTLVVVYSYTGNTLSAAKEVAKYFNADLLRIKAPQYSRDIKGHLLASKHADEEMTTVPIQHDPIDLKQYDQIFMCSPTWWFRPAPPLWSFVENHDLADSRVYLIMTGNSRMTDERTGKFGDLVESMNGEFLDVLFVRRGRIYWQKTPAQVNAEIIDALKKRDEL